MTNSNPKNYFWKYLRYKLSKRWAVMIFFAILNLVPTLIPVILVSNALKQVAKDVLVDSRHILISTPDNYLMLMYLAIPINIIIIVFTTIKSFRVYYKRPDMDTLGCLPISYKERFWGDFLSAVFLNFISFVPLYLVSLIFLGNMRGSVRDILNVVSDLDLSIYPNMFSAVWLMMLLVYLGVYAVTAFVCSCCGKKASSILYTIILMVILPGIFGVYAGYMLSYVVGMDTYAELTRIISTLPPLGPIVSVILASEYDSYDSMDTKYYLLGDNPFGLAVFLLITAVFIAGAYFIGKRRRAERVGESFAFKSVYHVLTITFMVLLIGASFVGYSNIMENSGVQWVLLFTFIVYAALELSENKSFKGFWKTAVRYAAVFGVCIGFFAIINGTNAFDMYKALPSVGSVKEIRLSGRYFYTPLMSKRYSMEYILSEKDSVSEILSEHLDFLETGNYSTGGYSAGEDIRIVYALKDGREITRVYVSKDSETEDRIKSICNNAKQLPDFDFGNLGVIDEPDLWDYTVSYQVSKMPTAFIPQEKLPQLIELLRDDLKYNYSVNNKTNSVGRLAFTKNGEKHDFNNSYFIYPTYTKTIEFLNNQNNYATGDVETGIAESYTFRYNGPGLSIDVHVSKDDTSDKAKELLTYIRPRRENDDYYDPKNPKKGVRITGDTSFITYTIDKENEQKVLKLMLELFLEKHPVDNSDNSDS